MSIESSEEIKNIFYQDSFSKKKIGSNVHRRTGKGSPTAKVAGGVRFAKNNFKKYEKNSKVREYNLYENITTYDEFKTLDKEEQENLLYEWMLRYPKIKIQTEMSIGEKRFNKILKEFNIDKRLGEQMRLSKEDLDKYKKEIIPSHMFKSLPADLKFELVDHYQHKYGMTNKEIADKLDYAINTFTTQKSLWKKEFERRIDPNMKHQDDFLLQGLDDDFEESDKATDSDNKVVVGDDEVQSAANSFSVRFDGEYSGSDIKKKIKAFDMLLQDIRKYKVTISVEDVEIDE